MVWCIQKGLIFERKTEVDNLVDLSLLETSKATEDPEALVWLILYINCMSWYTILILCLYKAFTLACDNGCDYLTPFLSLNKWSPVTCFYGFMWKLHFDCEGQLFFVFQQVKETWTCCHVVAMSLVKRNYQLWVNYNILYTVYIWITVSVYCTMYCTYTVVFCKIRSNLVCLSHREVPDSNPGV